jgi:hypothetical protein
MIFLIITENNSLNTHPTNLKATVLLLLSGNENRWKRVFCNVNIKDKNYKTEVGGALSPWPDSKSCPCQAGCVPKCTRLIENQGMRNSPPFIPSKPNKKKDVKVNCPSFKSDGDPIERHFPVIGMT